MEGSKGLVVVLRTLEAEVGGRRYIDGESLGYVDMALVPLMMLWFLTYERFGGFCVAEECPTLAVWRERDDSRGGRKRGKGGHRFIGEAAISLILYSFTKRRIDSK
ncbi:hypothetical protein GUJ93_ZPchr0005g16040 [Zizania palustris]|uniref:GST C-terminal domain-containing protein n=1 Tax=Zizania palustris TaxID=103762 RepID=A0A8J5T4K3_ZIZPA|nr:hypothetical protein GUJ93_ZPchr0005g16040 [Zizania palustris]